MICRIFSKFLQKTSPLKIRIPCKFTVENCIEMKKKLTLNIEGKTIGKAKEYAKRKGRSLSGLVEDYLKFLTLPLDKEPIGLSPKVKSILGSISVPDSFDYKKELSDRRN